MNRLEFPSWIGHRRVNLVLEDERQMLLDHRGCANIQLLRVGDFKEALEPEAEVSGLHWFGFYVLG